MDERRPSGAVLNRAGAPRPRRPERAVRRGTRSGCGAHPVSRTEPMREAFAGDSSLTSGRSRELAEDGSAAT